MANIGILGGTFDPPHNGHLALAKNAIKSLDLTKVLFVPSHIPPHKSHQKISSDSDRLKMLALAIADSKIYHISTIELERSGYSFTVDTLRQIKAEYPGDKILFLIGADNISEIESWRSPDEIFKLASVAAFTRPGFKITGKYANKIIYFDMEPLDLSSTDIRNLVRRGESISGLLPKSVAEYISASGLYRDA